MLIIWGPMGPQNFMTPGPLIFVLFVNDLPKTGRHGSINMYADDTTLYAEAETAEQAMEALGSNAQSTLDWYRQNRLIVNSRKTHLMVFGRKHRKDEISGTKLNCSKQC